MGQQALPVLKSARGAHLVGPRAEELEWEISRSSQDLDHSDNRCQSLGLGRLLEEDRSASPSSRRSSRFLLSSGEQKLFELEGVDRCLTYSPVSCTSPERSSSPGRDRQQHDQSLHQSYGRQVQDIVGDSSQPLVDSSETRIPSASSALARARSELARKSFVLFAVTCWPRCSDAARLVRSSIQFGCDGTMSFRYFGTRTQAPSP